MKQLTSQEKRFLEDLNILLKKHNAAIIRHHTERPTWEHVYEIASLNLSICLDVNELSEMQLQFADFRKHKPMKTFDITIIPQYPGESSTVYVRAEFASVALAFVEVRLGCNVVAWQPIDEAPFGAAVHVLP